MKGNIKMDQIGEENAGGNLSIELEEITKLINEEVVDNILSDKFMFVIFLSIYCCLFCCLL